MQERALRKGGASMPCETGMDDEKGNIEMSKGTRGSNGLWESQKQKTKKSLAEETFHGALCISGWESSGVRKRAQEVVSLLEKTTAELRAPDELLSGDIHIGGGETDAMRQIARIIGELHEDYPDIRYHIYSGNAEDITEKLDKGILDFGVFIGATDLSKYDYIKLPCSDTWGLVVRKDSSFAEKESIKAQDLIT